MKKFKAKYMMATTAIHQLGDISRDTPDLCVITGEEGDNYIGNWVTGFGFAHVKFPKATTKELTQKDIDKYHGKRISIGSGSFVIDIKEEKATNFMKAETHVQVKKLSAVANPKVRTAKQEEYTAGRGDNKLSPPVEHTIKGFLLRDVVVGLPASILRYERNGVETQGVMETTPITKIEGNQVFTANSVYEITELPPLPEGMI